MASPRETISEGMRYINRREIIPCRFTTVILQARVAALFRIEKRKYLLVLHFVFLVLHPVFVSSLARLYWGACRRRDGNEAPCRHLSGSGSTSAYRGSHKKNSDTIETRPPAPVAFVIASGDGQTRSNANMSDSALPESRKPVTDNSHLARTVIPTFCG